MAKDEHAPVWQAVDKLDEIRRVMGIGIHDDVVDAVKMLKTDYDEIQDAASRECTPEHGDEVLRGMVDMNKNLDAEVKRLQQRIEYLNVGRESDRQEMDCLRNERNSAELAAIYFAKRLEYQYHAE